MLTNDINETIQENQAEKVIKQKAELLVLKLLLKYEIVPDGNGLVCIFTESTIFKKNKVAIKAWILLLLQQEENEGEILDKFKRELIPYFPGVDFSEY
jgi:hypothetical protein